MEHRVLSNSAREDRRENPSHYRRLRTFVNDALGLPSTISPSVQLRATEKLRWQFRPIASRNKPPRLRPVNVKASQECTGKTALRILRHGSGRYVDGVARVCVAEQHPLSVEPVEVRATISAGVREQLGSPADPGSQ